MQEPDATGRIDGQRVDAAPRVRPPRGVPLQAELILVGEDLLAGSARDGHTGVVVETLAERGGRLTRVVVVGDDERAIRDAVVEALGRHPHLVITTGGLGPAEDDRTLAAVGAALGLPLTPSPRARGMVEAAYVELDGRRHGRSRGMTLAREKMARVPVGGEPIENEAGIAPGVLIRLAGGAAVLCLPGTPNEMRGTLREAWPELHDLAPRFHRVVREIETPTADESSLKDLLAQLAREHPRVGVTTRSKGPARQGHLVLVRLEASSTDENEAARDVQSAQRRLLALAGGIK